MPFFSAAPFMRLSSRSAFFRAFFVSVLFLVQVGSLLGRMPPPVSEAHPECADNELDVLRSERYPLSLDENLPILDRDS